jgi:hypothetical protein
MGHPEAFRLRSRWPATLRPSWTGVRMRRVTLAVLGAFAGVQPPQAAAQWRLGVEVGGERFRGVSGSVQPPDRAMRPYHPLWLGLRAEAPAGRLRLGGAIRYAVPDVALEAHDVTIVAHSTITKVLAITPEALVPLAGLGGVQLVGSAGLAVERWDFHDKPARWRAGPQAGLALEAGLGGRVVGALGGFGGYLPTSPLDAEDLPDDIEPRSAWRFGLRGSLLIRVGRQAAAGVPQSEQNRAPASSSARQPRH